MARTEFGAKIEDVPDVSRTGFQTRVEAEADVIKPEVTEGTFDSAQALVGLEREFYATTDRNGETTSLQSRALRQIPRQALSFIGFETELGLPMQK